LYEAEALEISNKDAQVASQRAGSHRKKKDDNQYQN
jgi:hypothetical protein